LKFLRGVFLNNISIKIIALALALLTWSYISGQLYKESIGLDTEAPSVIKKASGEKIIVKTLPIYVNIEGEPLPGYRIVLDKIVVRPSHSVVAGPPETIKNLSYISTEPVIVEGKNNTVKDNVKLSHIPTCRVGYEGLVKIAIPISRTRRR